MSRIIEKVFDAGKKIFKTKFRGSPNLLTTSDLNRQIDALKYQLDLLDTKTAVQSDFNLSIDTENKKVTFTYSYINVAGCSFQPDKTELGVPFTGASYTVVLTAKQKLVTYNDDFSHEIAGAKFEDGMSMPAADQHVYYDEKVEILTDETENVIAVLGRIDSHVGYSNAINYEWKSNCITKDSTLKLETKDCNVIHYVLPLSFFTTSMQEPNTVEIVFPAPLEIGDSVDVSFTSELITTGSSSYSLYNFRLLYLGAKQSLNFIVANRGGYTIVYATYDKSVLKIENIIGSSGQDVLNFASCGNLSMVYYKNYKFTTEKP